MRPNLMLAFAGLLLVASPTAQAVDYAFGTAAGSSDYDFSPVAETTKLALCFMDFNGDGVLGSGEPIFLLFKVATAGVCPADLSNNALLMNHVEGRLPGTEITQVDRWAGKTILSLAATNFVRYFEDGSDASKLDSKDTVYIDLKAVATPRVDVGDLRISAFGAIPGGHLVATGDADLNRPLSEIRGTARTVSTSSIIYKAGSAYYINSDAGAIGGISCTGAQGVPCAPTCTPAVTVPPAATGTCTVSGLATVDVGVESGDIRLNPKAVNPLSDVAVILPDHVEIVQSTVAPGQPFQVKVVAKNTGKAPGAGLVETRIGDQLVDSRGTPTIEANGVATLVLTMIAPATPGQHVVKSGAYADFLTVTAGGGDIASLQAQLQTLQAQVAALEDGSPSPASKLSVPGMGPAVLLLAVGLLAVALRRRA